MLSRSATASMAGRSSTMRRLRRRTSSASSAARTGRLFCATNGCASFLDVDPTTGIAYCQVCGFQRRLARSH